MKSCFFIGHADTPEDIFPGLSAAIECEITQNDVNEFYVGNHGRFDLLVYRALRTAKRQFPHIRCYLVTAYHPGSVRITAPADLDGIVYPLDHDVPPRFALPRTNRMMVDQCDVLIAAVRYPGRSREVLQHARRKEKRGMMRIVNLTDT